jgi:hypothetical protein
MNYLHHSYDYFGVGYINCIFGYNNCGMVKKLIELMKIKDDNVESENKGCALDYY